MFPFFMYICMYVSFNSFFLLIFFVFQQKWFCTWQYRILAAEVRQFLEKKYKIFFCLRYSILICKLLSSTTITTHIQFLLNCCKDIEIVFVFSLVLISYKMMKLAGTKKKKKKKKINNNERKEVKIGFFKMHWVNNHMRNIWNKLLAKVLNF